MLNYNNKINLVRSRDHLKEILLLACKGYIISRVVSLSDGTNELRHTSKDQVIKLDHYFEFKFSCVDLSSQYNASLSLPANTPMKWK